MLNNGKVKGFLLPEDQKETKAFSRACSHFLSRTKPKVNAFSLA